MAVSILRRKIPLVCTVDLIPSSQQANDSQSWGRKGVELSEGQHIIGDGQTDWMTEKVDLSSFQSTAESSSSSSSPPSPLEHDVKVPSDLEVMTSLLQEELAQLEDYFRSESTLTKLDKSPKCDKGTQAMGAHSYYQLPYASYSGIQSETSPLVATLETGELDRVSFCGGSIGRPNITRQAPYNYHHRSYNTCRRIVSDGVNKVGEELEHDTWSAKRSSSGSTEVAVSHCSTLKRVGKSIGSVKKVRECGVLLKEEESYCFTEDVFCSEGMTRGFCMGGSFDTHPKREGQLMHGMKVSGSGYDGMGLEVLHCNKDGGLSGGIPQEPEANGGYYHHHLNVAHTEPYHSFIGEIEEPTQVHGIEPQHGHYLFPESLGDQSYECLSRGESKGPMVGSPIHKQTAQRLKEDPCSLSCLKPGLVAVPLEVHTGERKQKKRDQNKTAAHRYRLRKRAELDILEEELHGLEGQNRELRDKAESVEREIQYVKDLLIEVYKTRSQRLKQDASA
uniref:Activating transcription factor 5b n=1 Tax=Hucho hucho TaxID=62062 RepID=A0A4W5JKA7_9TELE